MDVPPHLRMFFFALVAVPVFGALAPPAPTTPQALETRPVAGVAVPVAAPPADPAPGAAPIASPAEAARADAAAASQPAQAEAAQADAAQADAARGDAARADRLAEASLRAALPDFTRSLIYAGATALTVSLVGLALVGWRRRQW